MLGVQLPAEIVCPTSVVASQIKPSPETAGSLARSVVLVPPWEASCIHPVPFFGNAPVADTLVSEAGAVVATVLAVETSVSFVLVR